MNEKIRDKACNLWNIEGFCLMFKPNGKPDFFQVMTMCQLAQVRLEENNDDEIDAVLLDDGNKKVRIISESQLDELIERQTENRGNFYETKTDAIKDLDYQLKNENIDQEEYDSLKKELEKLKQHCSCINFGTNDHPLSFDSYGSTIVFSLLAKEISSNLPRTNDLKGYITDIVEKKTAEFLFLASCERVTENEEKFKLYKEFLIDRLMIYGVSIGSLIQEAVELY